MWLVLCGACLSPIELDAQPARATLTGSVRDAGGGALPGVVVSLSPQPAGLSRSTTTDAEGRYRFTALPAGDYQIRATLAGFASHEASAALSSGETRSLDITLAISPFTETVTVTRSVEGQSRVPNAVSVIQGDDVQSFQRRASPAEAFVGIPGFYVENRRNFSLSGGVRFAIRAPLSRFGMRGVQNHPGRRAHDDG